MAKSRLTVKRFDKDCQRIYDGEEIVGFALRLANDQRGLFDADEKRLSNVPFDKPAQVRDALERRMYGGSL